MTENTKKSIKQRLDEIEDFASIVFTVSKGISETDCLRTVANEITEKVEIIESLLEAE